MANITVIGAGSASFGENTLAALMRSKKLKGSTLALVDRNADTLDIVHRLAQRLNREWDAQFSITSHTDHRDALPGSRFVVNAIEVGARENLWQTDFEIPIRHGVRQPYAENGGPGGFAHAARNIRPVLEIARKMEQFCPGAWLINYTNPSGIIAEGLGKTSECQGVWDLYFRFIREFGDEHSILTEVPVADLARVSPDRVAVAIDRMRQGQVRILPGHDGEYGSIRIFGEEAAELEGVEARAGYTF